jgi:putative tricarboxylic transport membrane protein
MSDPSLRKPGTSDRAGALGCVLAIALGAAAIWAARDYSALGAVFPRTVGVLLVALGVLYLGMFALGRTQRASTLEGSTARRAALAAIMLGWGFALGPVGFLPSSAAAMALLMAVAHHERWTPRTGLLYGLAAAVVLSVLYVLFKHVLLVPLP